MLTSVRTSRAICVLGSVLALTVVAHCCAGSESVSGTADQEEALRLAGCRVAIIIAEGYHEHEFWFPYYRFREEGAEVIVAAPEKGTVYGEGRHGTDGLPAKVTETGRGSGRELDHGGIFRMPARTLSIADAGPGGSTRVKTQNVNA